MSDANHIVEAIEILTAVGLPHEQRNERSALCLLAVLNLQPNRNWSEAEAPLIGITPIMDWAALHYGKKYAPNSRETFRRFSMHQFVSAGLVAYNPDKSDRPVNSPQAVYQISPSALDLVRTYGAPEWNERLNAYLEHRETLVQRYAKTRVQNLVPVAVALGQEIMLSPGEHSQLIKMIIEDFAARFVPGAELVYVGDTGDKWGYVDKALLASLGVAVDAHGKMPDVALYDRNRNWLVLVESVTSHGPVDGKRHAELADLFLKSSAGLVYVTAFPDRKTMARYLGLLAWETEVWVADAPSHLIHFNGDRFLGPHAT